MFMPPDLWRVRTNSKLVRLPGFRVLSAEDRADEKYQIPEYRTMVHFYSALRMSTTRLAVATPNGMRTAFRQGEDPPHSPR